MRRVAASPLCPPCEGGSCDVDPADCRHGVVRDHCGRQVCAKGPGQRCGGKGDLLGRCGEGMHCKCNRCAGCSLATLECDLSEFLCLS
ncbi:Neuroparsin-A [Gryllus bimaculatus]|nr:Neuroparsin-A [Gryllus bimaculatus]